MGKKTSSATFGCHDLDTADGLAVLNGTAVVNAMYSIKLGVRVYSDWTRQRQFDGYNFAGFTSAFTPSASTHSGYTIHCYSIAVSLSEYLYQFTA